MMNWFLRALRKAAKSFESHRDEDKFFFKFDVTVEKDELDGGYVAESIDFPGCVAEGETEEEALENIIDALGGVLTVRLQKNLREMGGGTNPVTNGSIPSSPGDTTPRQIALSI